MKTILFIDVDGVLNTIKEDSDGPTWKENRNEFLTWAKRDFDCRFLTAWHEKELYLELPPQFHFPVEPWRHSKLEVIEKLEHKNWIWIDDSPFHFAGEMSILDAMGCKDNLILVDPTNKNALTKVMRLLTDKAPF